MRQLPVKLDFESKLSRDYKPRGLVGDTGAGVHLGWYVAGKSHWAKGFEKTYIIILRIARFAEKNLKSPYISKFLLILQWLILGTVADLGTASHWYFLQIAAYYILELMDRL